MGKRKKIELIDINHLDSWLGSTGFLFPTNELELDRFNKLSEDYDFKLDEIHVDPIAIINNTFHRASKVISILENEVSDEIDSLKMVARKGRENLPQHIIEKMRKNHNMDSCDSE